MLNSLKEACFVKDLTEWVIYSYDHIEEDESISHNADIDIDNTDINPLNRHKYEEISESPALMRPVTPEEFSNDVMILPSVVKVKGKKLSTPAVYPPLAPIQRRGQTVGYVRRSSPPSTLSLKSIAGVIRPTQASLYKARIPVSPT